MYMEREREGNNGNIVQAIQKSGETKENKCTFFSLVRKLFFRYYNYFFVIIIISLLL